MMMDSTYDADDTINFAKDFKEQELLRISWVSGGDILLYTVKM